MMKPFTRTSAIKIVYTHALAIFFVICVAASMLTRRIHRHDELILRVSRSQGLDPRLVAGMIWKESRFDPLCIGKKGEIGLMQITGGAVTDWANALKVDRPSREQLFDPALNLRIGCWYFARAIRHWRAVTDDPLPYALAEYNAGRSNADRWADDDDIRTSREYWHRISYPTTRRYVRDILERYRGGI